MKILLIMLLTWLAFPLAAVFYKKIKEAPDTLVLLIAIPTAAFVLGIYLSLAWILLYILG